MLYICSGTPQRSSIVISHRGGDVQIFAYKRDGSRMTTRPRICNPFVLHEFAGFLKWPHQVQSVHFHQSNCIDFNILFWCCFILKQSVVKHFGAHLAFWGGTPWHFRPKNIYIYIYNMQIFVYPTILWTKFVWNGVVVVPPMNPRKICMYPLLFAPVCVCMHVYACVYPWFWLI